MIKTIIKKSIKKGIFPFLFSIGTDWILQKITRNKRMIIMYHGVSSCDCFKINGRHLPDKEFEKHIQYYKKHFDIVSLSQIYTMRRGNYIPKRPTIALTFDDGFINNLDIAIPILEKHGVPATFFVTTAPIEKPDSILFSEILEIGCAFSEKDEVQLGGIVFKKTGKYKWTSTDGQTLYGYLQQQKPQEKTKLILDWKTQHKLDEKAKQVNKQCYALMNEKQLKQLASSPLVEIGSHAHSHHLLTLLTDDELTFELQHSKSLLEKSINKKVESIAFPDGYYNKRVLDFCSAEGYKNLIAVGLNETKDRTITELVPRMGVSCSDGLAFNMILISLFFNTNGF